eukprot:scaffold3135_cov18-Tisochrysis_lutea.AAC.1
MAFVASSAITAHYDGRSAEEKAEVQASRAAAAAAAAAGGVASAAGGASGGGGGGGGEAQAGIGSSAGAAAGTAGGSDAQGPPPTAAAAPPPPAGSPSPTTAAPGNGLHSPLPTAVTAPVPAPPPARSVRCSSQATRLAHTLPGGAQLSTKYPTLSVVSPVCVVVSGPAGPIPGATAAAANYPDATEFHQSRCGVPNGTAGACDEAAGEAAAAAAAAGTVAPGKRGRGRGRGRRGKRGVKGGVLNAPGSVMSAAAAREGPEGAGDEEGNARKKQRVSARVAAARDSRGGGRAGKVAPATGSTGVGVGAGAGSHVMPGLFPSSRQQAHSAHPHHAPLPQLHAETRTHRLSDQNGSSRGSSSSGFVRVELRGTALASPGCELVCRSRAGRSVRLPLLPTPDGTAASACIPLHQLLAPLPQSNPPPLMQGAAGRDAFGADAAAVGCGA